MAEVHVSATTWQKLLAGEPFEGREALVRHLSEGCETCEDVIAGLGPDALDGTVDLALALAGRAAVGGSELEFQRIWSRTRATPSSIPWFAAAAAVIAAVATAILLRTPPPLDHGRGVKGTEVYGEIDLSFAIGSKDAAGTPHLEKGLRGQTYPSDRDVMIRYRVNEPGYVAIVRVPDEGLEEVVVDARRVTPGEYDLETNGQPAGYPLQGLSGRQRFVAILSGRPLSSGELQAAARTEPPPGPEMAFGSFEIRVSPPAR